MLLLCPVVTSDAALLVYHRHGKAVMVHRVRKGKTISRDLIPVKAIPTLLHKHVARRNRRESLGAPTENFSAVGNESGEFRLTIHQEGKLVMTIKQSTRCTVCRVPGWVVRPVLGVSVFALAFAFSAVTPVLAHEAKDHHVSDVRVTETWMIRKGGRMYANWADELGKELPAKTHPSYPKTSKKKGKTTWRCKECHGWDYQGVAGAYGSGSHFTGIKGIQDMMGQNPGLIARILRNKTHGYSKKMIPDKDMEALTLFVSWGQVRMDRYIDRKTRRANGDVRHGAAIFQTTCAVCHGLDGTLINFGSDKNPEFIGTVANENPWETLHNIRFGHAGDAMIGLIAFPVQDQVDALSYAQTLPTK